MALIDSYQNNIQRKKEEMTRLSSSRAAETKKLSDLKVRINTANRNLMSTKSLSIQKSKLSEINRYEKSCADIERKIADIDKKIANKNKEIAAEEKKYNTEKTRMDKKSIDEDKKRLRQSEQQLARINQSIERQAREQYQIKQTIEDMKKIPEKITVLFLASNPIETSQLQLGEEARDIQEKINLSQHRDSVRFETRWAVRPNDILQAINEVNPTVIHFSGHGAEDDGELVLQNPDGSAKLVKKEAITQAINTVSDHVRLVFFNTCFSATQAEAITSHIEAAIGMTSSIGDTAARVFAAQFYSSIGFGLTLEQALNQAKAALMLEDIPEESTPNLYTKEGISSEEIYLVSP